MGYGAKRIDGDRASGLVAAGATLLDVRTPMEFRMDGIDGAQNIPLQVLHVKAGEIDRENPVVVYCRSGSRSAFAVQMLEQAGFEAYDLGPRWAWRG